LQLNKLQNQNGEKWQLISAYFI